MTNRFATFWTTIWLGILFILAFAWSPDSYGTDNEQPDPSQDQQQEQAQRQDQAQAQGQEQGQQQSQANNQAVSFEDELQAPASFAPSIAPTAPCYYTVGAAFSFPGGSLGGGKAIKDEDCEFREELRLGYQMGLVNETRQLWCERYGQNVSKCGRYEPTPRPEPVPTVIVLQGESCASKESINRVFERCVSK